MALFQLAVELEDTRDALRAARARATNASSSSSPASTMLSTPTWTSKLNQNARLRFGCRENSFDIPHSAFRILMGGPIVAKSSSKNEPKSEPKNEKVQLLDSALSQIEKAYGKGSIMRFGDMEALDVPVISTAPSRSISPWASAASRAGASPKSTAPSPRVKPRWRCTSSPTRKRPAGVAGLHRRRARHGPAPTRANWGSTSTNF